MCNIRSGCGSGGNTSDYESGGQDPNHGQDAGDFTLVLPSVVL